MSPTVRRLEVKEIDDLARLVAENAEGIEPGLKVIDSRLLLGQAAIDLVGLDAKGAFVLIALDFTADEGLLLRGMDAYSWCLEYPDTICRLYPAAEISATRPPRTLFIVERFTDAFVRRIKQLCFRDIDCLEFRHLEVNGASALYFDLVERVRQADVALDGPMESESRILEVPRAWQAASPDPAPAAIHVEPMTDGEPIADPEPVTAPASAFDVRAAELLAQAAASVFDEPRLEDRASVDEPEPAEPARPEIRRESFEEAARPPEPVTFVVDAGSNLEWRAFLSTLGVEVPSPDGAPTVEIEPTASAGRSDFFATAANGTPAASVPAPASAPGPAAQVPAPVSPAPAAPKAEPATGKPTILVVDDAGPVVSLCVNVLQTLRYSIRTAGRGATALELLGKEPFDLLIVDYMMPGMNGFDVLEQARKLRPEIACILMTAYGTPDILSGATRIGFNAILRKPFTPSELRATVEKVFAGAGATPPRSATAPGRIG